VSAAAGPFTIAALLLVVGGIAKVFAPADTANALRAVGVPAPPMLVRIGGAAEAVIGGLAIATADRAAALLVAVSYLAFAGFVGVALRRGSPIATCGCFGKADTPPSLVHLFVNVGAAAAALAIAVDPGDGIADVVSAQPLSGVPYLLLVVVGAYVAFLSLTLLPRTLALVRQSRGS
jgi:methylamine utilization protein MauE